MNKALSPGDDKGITLLCGGKRTLKIGDLMGTVIVPFHKLETDEDFEWLEELATEILGLLCRERPSSTSVPVR